jgi:hypothetical protein
MQLQLTSVRFIHLEETTPLAGLRYRQRDTMSPEPIFFHFDAVSFFPHLVLLAVVNVTKTPHRLQLMLFRPISLATLLEICNKWTSGIATDLISLFSRHYYMSESLERVPCSASPTSKHITDIVLKPGAYVSWSRNARDTAMRPQAVQHLSWCTGHVHIEDDGDTKGIKETLAMIFGYPGRIGEPRLLVIGSESDISSCELRTCGCDGD